MPPPQTEANGKIMKMGGSISLLDSLYLFFTNEKSFGILVLKENPFQVSSQKKHEEPSPTIVMAIPMNAVNNF